MRRLFPTKGTAPYDLLRELLLDHHEDERICAQDPELWWQTDTRGMAEAKRLCLGGSTGQACPLLQICGQYAVLAIEPNGVWGGMTPEDRSAARRRLARIKVRDMKRAQRAAQLERRAS